MRLLIVEDDESHALIMLDMLRASGVDASNTTRVRSTREAVQELRSSSFDVITLDLGLPDSNGTDAVLRLVNEGRRTPVVVVSSSAGAQTILEAVRSGARDYLVKGKFDSSRLMQVLEAAASWGSRLKELPG